MYEQRIQFRRDIAIKWAQFDPVLADGEPGYEIDTGKWKIGDGIKPWNSLGYMAEDGLQGPVGPQGPAGAASTVPGPAGPKGADSTVPGPATTITIGTVTAGNTPADAAASMSGTSPNQVLNLVLPKGDTGATGAKGDQGVQGVAGVQGNAGPVGPQGPQGLAGPAGPKGDAAGINIKGTATTWPPDASPDNDDLWLLPDPIPAGTPSSYKPGDGIVWTGTVWLNVGPVRGPAGPEGPAGPVGPQGNQGNQGVQGVEGPQGVKGDRGDVGPIGPQGPQGVKGDTGAAGADGADGADGAAGADAPPSNLTIGTVIEGPTADASITGTSPNFILNLTLPQPSLSHVTTFTVNPQNQTVEDGDSVTFTAEAQSTGTNIVYKWQKLGLGSWEDIPGAGGKTYTFNATTAQNGRQYRCYASTPEGAVAASMAAVLTVKAAVVPPKDGSDWTSVYGSGFQTQPLAFVNGKFIDRARFSVTGLEWGYSEYSSSSGDSPCKVVYGNGVYAHGDGYRSADGEAWTAAVAFDTGSPGSIAFNGTDFLAANSQGTILRKTQDGVTSQSITPNLSGGGLAVRHLAADPVSGRWICYGYDSANSKHHLAHSTDGETWTSSKELSSQANRLVHLPNAPSFKYVALLDGLKVLFSTDGQTWVEKTMPTSAAWYDICYGEGIYMAVASGGTKFVATSPDATTWTILSTLPESGNWQSIAYGNGIFVAKRVNEYPSLAIAGGTVGHERELPPDFDVSVPVPPVSTNWLFVSSGSAIFPNCLAVYLYLLPADGYDAIGIRFREKHSDPWQYATVGYGGSESFAAYPNRTVSILQSYGSLADLNLGSHSRRYAVASLGPDYTKAYHFEYCLKNGSSSSSYVHLVRSGAQSGNDWMIEPPYKG